MKHLIAILFLLIALLALPGLSKLEARTRNKHIYETHCRKCPGVWLTCERSHGHWVYCSSCGAQLEI